MKLLILRTTWNKKSVSINFSTLTLLDIRMRHLEQGKSGEPVLPSFKESEVCGVCHQEGKLLICDGDCKWAFHLHCVGLQTEPKSQFWFCPECRKKDKFLQQMINTPVQRRISSTSHGLPSSTPSKSSKTSNTTVFTSELLMMEQQKKVDKLSHLGHDMTSESKIKRRKVR